MAEPRSSVGLHFSVAIEVRRQRGLTTDVWEARLTTLAIALVAAVVIVYALVQVFMALHTLFGGL